MCHVIRRYVRRAGRLGGSRLGEHAKDLATHMDRKKQIVVIAVGMALSVVRGADATQDIHSAFVSIGKMVVLWERLDCRFEIIDKPGTQNAVAITYVGGRRQIEVDETWYANLPAGRIWGIVYVMGHEIGISTYR